MYHSRLPLIQSPGGHKTLRINRTFLNKKRKNTVVIKASLHHVSLLDFVNLDFRHQVKCTTRNIAKTKAWSIHHTNCSHGAACNKEGWELRKRDAYAGATLNWPAALWTACWLSCNGADISTEHSTVFALQNWEFIDKWWSPWCFYSK